MSLIETLLSWITPTTIAIYVIIHILTYIIFITIGSSHIINASPDLNKKYAPFARTDLHMWSIVKRFPCK